MADVGSTHTFSHTCSGANRILFVSGRNYCSSTASDVVTGVTYNGVAMTRLTAYALYVAGATADWDYVYYIIAPATGANNIVVSCSATSNAYFRGHSYTGVKQTGFPDASASAYSGTGTSITSTLTTIADNCWLVGLHDNEQNIQTAGANTTIRNITNSGIISVDTNSAQTPAGSKSMSSSWSGSGPNYYSIVSIAPAPSNPANLFPFFI